MQELMPSPLWRRLRMQSCDQYGQTLVFERHLEKVASQRSAPFLVRATSELRGAACGAQSGRSLDVDDVRRREKAEYLNCYKSGSKPLFCFASFAASGINAE
jgi:surface antigen